MMEEIKSIGTERYVFEYRTNSKLISFLEFLDYQYSDTKVGIHEFPMEKSYSSIEVSIEQLSRW